MSSADDEYSKIDIDDLILSPEKERELVENLFAEVDYDIYKEVFYHCDDPEENQHVVDNMMSLIYFALEDHIAQMVRAAVSKTES